MNKTWKVKGQILSDAIFEQDVIIDNIQFNAFDGKTYIETVVNGDSTEEARKVVLNKFEDVSSFLAFETDSKFKLIITDVIQIVSKGERGYGESDILGIMSIPRIITNQDIENINKLIKMNSELDKITKAALKYYERGIKIQEWNTESFINYFKVIELLSNKYLDKAKQEQEEENREKLDQNISKIIAEIKSGQYDRKIIIKSAKEIYNIGKVGLRRRIELAAIDLGVEEFTEEDIKKLVRTRNEVSAHANSQSELIGDEELKMCKSFAKKILHGYIQKQINEA